MSKRSQIIAALIDHISDSTSYTGFRGLRFLHEINTFPSFYVHPTNERRIHDSRNSRQAVLQLDIRGYGWSEGSSYIDELVRNIETSIQTFRSTHRSLLYEARVTSLRTDEGAMEPYCICDLTLEILYGINDD